MMLEGGGSARPNAAQWGKQGKGCWLSQVIGVGGSASYIDIVCHNWSTKLIFP